MKVKIQELDIEKIVENPDNPRVIKDSKFQELVKSIQEFPQMLYLRPIVLNEDNVALGGNQRLKACKEAGMDKVPVIYAKDLTEEQQKEFIIKDNVSFGEWHWDVLEEWGHDSLEGWGLDVPVFSDPEEESNAYTKKIESPIYKPSAEKPNINTLLDKKKYLDLLEDIEKMDLPSSEEEFLKMCATRHIVFDYSKIADFYAHSSKEVQELMENSALVIIDFNKAIELGYVSLSEDVAKQFKVDNHGEEE